MTDTSNQPITLGGIFGGLLQSAKDAYIATLQSQAQRERTRAPVSDSSTMRWVIGIGAAVVALVVVLLLLRK
jgi:hypothetical protein